MTTIDELQDVTAEYFKRHMVKNFCDDLGLDFSKMSKAEIDLIAESINRVNDERERQQRIHDCPNCGPLRGERT